VKNQIALITISLLLVFLLFFFGRTIKNKENLTNFMSDSGEFDVQAYINESKQRLMIIPKDSLALLESLFASRKPDSSKLVYLSQIVNIWENSGNFAVASEYQRRTAVFDSTSVQWEKAGDMLFEAFKTVPDTSVRSYLLQRSIESFSNASSIDTTNESATIKLAETYIDGTNNIMAGVTLLLDVVKRNPENISANLILGRLAVVSGQYDKAITRLTGILDREPENVEALFYIAGAFEKTGQKQKAISYYKICQKLVKNPAINQQIDNYLKNLK